MAQPCALSVSLNLLLLITSFIGSNKSIINDVLSSIKDSPSWDHQTAPTQSRMRHETLDYLFSTRGLHDTITDETWDSHDTFDTKFWDSIKLMNPCVFDVCQYLRVLRLSCLSCSIVVIIIVTLMQTDRQSIYCVCHEWLNDAIHGHKGEISSNSLPHKAMRKFHVFWCLKGSAFHRHPWYCCLSRGAAKLPKRQYHQSWILNPHTRFRYPLLNSDGKRIVHR